MFVPKILVLLLFVLTCFTLLSCVLELEHFVLRGELNRILNITVFVKRRMKLLIKPFSLMLVLLVLSVPLSFASFTRCAPVSVECHALNYIQSVLPFDLSKYDIELNSSYTLPQGPNTAFTQESVAYTLNSYENTLYVHFMFWDGKLYECAVTIISGAVFAATSYVNLSEFAHYYLERYQMYSGLDSTELIKTLDMIDENQSMNVSLGNLTFAVRHLSMPTTMSFASGQAHHLDDMINFTEFNWKYIINDVEYTPITMRFQEGNFSRFTDNRVIYTIGDTDVAISKEQAIDAAMNYIKGYSYTATNGAKINRFIVDASKTTANLVNFVKGYNVLYPCWDVVLVLNQTYPDDVNSFIVRIWAGNGEVSSCTAEPFGYYPRESNPESATLATTWAVQPEDAAALVQTAGKTAESAETPLSNTFLTTLIATIAIAAIAATMTTAFLKKRNK